MMNVSLRSRLFAVLEAGRAARGLPGLFNRFMIGLIAASVIITAIESAHSDDEGLAPFFLGFETFVVAVFAIEYVLRIWVFPEHVPAEVRRPVVDRLRYVGSPMGIVDLLAFLPFVVTLLVAADPGAVLVMRTMRLLKLARYSPAVETVAAVVRSQRRSLTAALYIMAICLVFASGIIFLLEREAQPEKFGNILLAMWWGLATLATVGFGDVTPITPVGKLFGGLVMILGIAMYALPAGILATGFSREIRKRDFVVTWRLVAGVPLFARLDALRIDEIASLLQPKLVPAHYVIVRRGDPADAMYFIISGEVEVDVRPASHHLGPGDFFGEIALLKDSLRTATVTAITECQLLTLEAGAFKRLLRTNPDLRQAMTKVMEKRLADIEGRSPAGPAKEDAAAANPRPSEHVVTGD